LERGTEDRETLHQEGERGPKHGRGTTKKESCRQVKERTTDFSVQTVENHREERDWDVQGSLKTEGLKKVGGGQEIPSWRHEMKRETGAAPNKL